MLPLQQRSSTSSCNFSPRFPEPVAHDRDHGRPARGLQQPVEDPEDDVIRLVVDVQPLAHAAEHEDAHRGAAHTHRQHLAHVKSVADGTTDVEALGTRTQNVEV